MFSHDRVADEEVLYRRVPNHPINFGPVVDGVRRVSSAAFGDRGLQPSVDRAWLRDNKPENSQLSPTDCIASLVAFDVRTKTNSSRTIDVRPDPIKNDPELPDNPTHALITAEPAFTSNNTEFKKFKRALARLSRWEIAPSDPV